MRGKYHPMKKDSNRIAIQKQAASFGQYIDRVLSENNAKELIDSVSAQVPVFVFSGVIRDFFLNKYAIRDIDFVIMNSKEVNIPLSLLRPITIGKNRFDGYKLLSKDLTIDCWDVAKTWGIRQEGMKETAESLLKTAFFNFSAIVYDYNRKEFLISDDFCKFLVTHTMEVIFPKNPKIETCIVNTLYYADHFDFKIGRSLRNWIIKNYRLDLDFASAQMRRYQQVFYSNEVIRFFVEICAMTEGYDYKMVHLYDSQRHRIIDLQFDDRSSTQYIKKKRGRLLRRLPRPRSMRRGRCSA